MKSYLVLFGFFLTICAEQKIVKKRSETDKQENDGIPTYYKLRPQTYSSQKGSAGSEQLINYNPQSVSYSPQISYEAPQQSLKYTNSPIPAHIMYGFAPQVQQQLQYAAEPVAYAQPATKSAGASARVPSVAAINFSPASEVSSFRFSSPLVTYSNQGVLQQLTGKVPSEKAIQVSQESNAPQPKRVASTPSPLVYSQAPQFATAPQEKQEYAYKGQEFTYASLPQQQIAYVTVPQRSSHAQQQQQQEKAAYTSGPKQYYTIASQQAAYSPQQAAYSPQQAAYSPQQVAYSPSDSQQFAYILVAPQNARGASQPVYVDQQQPKYANQGEYSQ